MSADAAGPRRFALTQLLTVAINAVTIILTLAVLAMMGRPFDDEGGLLMVVISAAFGPVSLCAAWLALGPFSFPLRLVWAPTAATLCLFISAIALALARADGKSIAGIFVAGGAQFLLLQAPYWLLRWSNGLRVMHASQFDELALPERFQFRLWQMLLVTTVAAIVLGIGRGLVSLLTVSGFRARDLAEMVVFLTLFVGFNLLLAWPMIWAVLSPGRAGWKIAVALALVAATTAVEYPVVASLLGNGGAPWWCFILLNGPQIFCLAAHLVATRICGYRLVRWT